MNAGEIMFVASWVGLVALNLYAIYWQHRYQCAFRDTAQKLYNVTIERDKLKIQNEGLKSELARVCVENERMCDQIELRAIMDAGFKITEKSQSKPDGL